MKGNSLLVALYPIRRQGGAEVGEVWKYLPESAGGAAWKEAITYCAGRITDYVNEDDEYDFDSLNDLAGEYAEESVQDYYVNINAQVQEMSLWANIEIEDRVKELGLTTYSLTKLQEFYLYQAQLMIWEAVIRVVWEVAEVMEGSRA